MDQNSNIYKLYFTSKDEIYNGRNNILGLILMRFGIDIKNDKKYMLGYSLDMNKIIVLVTDTKKIIELKLNANFTLDIENCFIIDKISKKKLIFNIMEKNLPFSHIIPHNSAYLCYNLDNQYYLEFINLESFIQNIDLDYSKSMYNIENNKKLKFKENIILKISPSLLLPSVENFNIDDYIFLFKFYFKKPIKLIKYNDKFKNNYVIGEEHIELLTMEESEFDKLTLVDIQDLLKLPKLKKALELESDYEKIIKKPSIIVDDYFDEIKEIINSCYPLLTDSLIITSDNDKKFRNVLKTELDEKKSRNIVYDSFINENRLCTVYNCLDTCPLIISESIKKLTKIRDREMSTLKKSNDSIEYIMKNLDKFILIMETNLLINYLSKINDRTSCWDVQFIINIMDNICFLNEDILKGSFIGYEILYLLQNEYFFKESQICKYREIIEDIRSNNKSLKLHQFMMGKGKTSVITPLLSFYVSLIAEKKPTIITVDHLVDQTKKYLSLTQHLLDLDINIFSDSDAKLRWLTNTDTNLKKEPLIDLSNEINIIDEFDSHHNYLQSMFNSVLKKQKINDDIYNLIFDYVICKLNKNKFTVDSENILEGNKEILFGELEILYESALNMRFNDDYGFSFLHNKEYLDKLSRLVIPFSRKDTPMYKSNFSSLLLTLILTIKAYYEEYESKLQDFDFLNLSKNIKILGEIGDILEEKYYSKAVHIMTEITIPEYQKEKLIKELFEEIYSTNPEIKNIILKKYLYEVNKYELEITKEQVNMSFQDIIYNKYNQIQIGYTGTTSLSLNKYQDSDEYVFREKIEDFDEVIEVKLALEGYGAPDSWKNNVITIKKTDSVDDNLNIIINNIITNPRGFVDLAGLFLKNSNKEIADKINKILISKGLNKKIIYFSDKHQGIEFSDKIGNLSYTPNDLNNFYYYDRCHVVGSDLKQPREGHISIIIDKNTRWTDFAQAIFRFRKLNRGTYMNVIYLESDIIINDNNEVYTLLRENETVFNKNQEDGLKYQLLKAMVRKHSENYLENDLKPVYLYSDEMDKEKILEKLVNNIKGISEFIDKENYINTIFNYFKELTLVKLKKLVLGSINSKQLDQEEEQIEEEEEEEEEELNIEILTRLRNEIYPNFAIKNICVLNHMNCNYCSDVTYTKLFKTDEIKINGKSIVISYNFLQLIAFYQFIAYKEKSSDTNPYYEQIDYSARDFVKKSGRFCFVELPNEILIEREDISLSYYLHKLPVYDYMGKIILPYMKNNNNEINPLILDIDELIIQILGLKNYINPIKKEKKKYNISEQMNNFTNPGLLLFNLIFIYQRVKRYNIAREYIDYIGSFDFVKAAKEIKIDSSEHSEITLNNSLDKIYFDSYSELSLGELGYDKLVCINTISYYYDYEYEVINSTKKNRFISFESLAGGKYYNKYIKYKNKYLKFKNRM